MPKKIENKLKMEATRKGLKGKQWRSYVYGTMNKIEKDKHRKHAKK